MYPAQEQDTELGEIPGVGRSSNCAEAFSEKSVCNSSSDLYPNSDPTFHENESSYQQNNNKVIHIDSRTQCHQDINVQSVQTSQKKQRYEVTLERNQFQPQIGSQERKYISTVQINRDYSACQEQDQDSPNAVYQTYYEFKPTFENGEDNQSRNREQLVDNGLHKYTVNVDACSTKGSSVEASSVFRKPAEGHRHFQQREDSQSLFVDYGNTSNKQKQSDYQIENEAFVENSNTEQQHEQILRENLSGKSRSCSETSQSDPNYYKSTFSFVPHQQSSGRCAKAEVAETPSKCEAQNIDSQTFQGYIGHSVGDSNQQLGLRKGISRQSSSSNQSSSPVFHQRGHSYGVPDREYHSSSPVFWCDDQANTCSIDSSVSVSNKTTERESGGWRENNSAVICLTDNACDPSRGSIYDNDNIPGHYQSSESVSDGANIASSCRNTCGSSADSDNYRRGEPRFAEISRNYQNTFYDNANNAENYGDNRATIYDNVNDIGHYQNTESPYDNTAGPYEHFLYPHHDGYY